jgi:voltage-dependent calcium channel T type alpha-1H
VTFVLVAQFVLVNVVVAVLMKHLEENNKEAREDAEMDAEIELAMAQGPPAQPPPAVQVGPAKSLGAVILGVPPNRHEFVSFFPQESPGAGPDTPNLLVVRKVSVSRMLSLPNDSYMFRPVAPAAAAHPHPLQEVEMEIYSGHAPSGTDAGRGSERARPGRRADGIG